MRFKCYFQNPTLIDFNHTPPPLMSPLLTVGLPFPGDLCRVERAGDNFIWQSCLCDGWGMPDGPVPPEVEIARLEQACCQERDLNPPISQSTIR